MNIFLGIMIPFVGTALGAACVFLLKMIFGRSPESTWFRVRIMVAASVWSL